MDSTIVLIIALLILFISTNVGSKKSVDKIIIHVPYKIHKHHHIHTKYKVITIPEAKKEKQIIIYKELPQYQPLPKFIEHPHLPEGHKDMKDKSKGIISHHFSEVSGLDTYTSESQPDMKFTEISHYPQAALEFQKESTPSSHIYSEIPDIQTANENQPFLNFKPQEMQSAENSPSEMNHVPNAAFKPSMPLTNTGFTPTFFLPQIISPPQEENLSIYSKFSPSPLKQNSLPILTSTFYELKPTYSHKNINPMTPLKSFHKTSKIKDNIAHSSHHFYKTEISSKPTKGTSYSVKEPNQDFDPPPKKHQQNPFAPNKNKFWIKPNSHYLNSFPPKTMRDTDSEYEHVGYLIIDGNSQKIVDKNFDNELYR